MKRIIAVLLTVLLIAGIFAGCGKQGPPVETTAPAAPTTAPEPSAPAETAPASARGRVVEVTNMEELLAAIGPDTEIVLNPGTYVLTDARDYGVGGNNYYSWIDCFDGFELQINKVQGLTIRGASANNTTLQAIPRYANVLTLSGCTDILLQDLTIGHTKGIPGECTGGVLNLNGSDEISVERCGLYGCGTVGISAYYSDNLTVTDSDLYECSSAGIELTNCRDTVVRGSHIRNLGAPYNAYAAMSINTSKRVSVTDCTFSENDLYALFTISDSVKVELLNNSFDSNNVQGSVFSMIGSDVVFTGNSFSGLVRSWYDAYSYCVTDAQGKELTEADLAAMYPDSMPNFEPTAEGELTEVHVSTADEFLNALQSNTVIIMDSKLIDLSTATEYGYGTSDYYYWEDNFDGPALYIHDLHDLTIRSNDGKTTAHTLAAIPRYADVLQFLNCQNITLSGFTAGHTKEPGSCMGGVFHFVGCDVVNIDHCGMFGCGILGIQATSCTAITVEDSNIYECSQGGINMWDVRGITINRCTFRDLGGDRLFFYNCSQITEDGQELGNGYYN